ncbi:MAG: DsbA family protein [Patescibacteria group bacterium]
MPEISENLLINAVEPRHPGRRRLGIVLFILLLCGVSFFGYKVFQYYRKIQLGVIDPLTYSFQSTVASQSRLLAIAQAAPGSGALATADDPSRGPADAKLTIVEFADFGCPFSEQESYVIEAIARQYPEDVRVVYRDFPLTDIHPGADLAAEASECANEQGKFWEYHDVLYRNSGNFTEDALVDFATQLNLNTGSFRTCLQSGKYTDEVAQDLADGVAAGVTGTPTFFLNGEKIDGAVPFSTFKEIVEAFLAE